MGFTKPLTVTTTPATLKSLLETAGYVGPPRTFRGGALVNTDAANDCYISAHTSGSSAPTASDGVTFGPNSGFTSWQLPADIDLAAIWLTSASGSITVSALLY